MKIIMLRFICILMASLMCMFAHGARLEQLKNDEEKNSFDRLFNFFNDNVGRTLNVCEADFGGFCLKKFISYRAPGAGFIGGYADFRGFTIKEVKSIDGAIVVNVKVMDWGYKFGQTDIVENIPTTSKCANSSLVARRVSDNSFSIKMENVECKGRVFTFYNSLAVEIDLLKLSERMIFGGYKIKISGGSTGLGDGYMGLGFIDENKIISANPPSVNLEKTNLPELVSEIKIPQQPITLTNIDLSPVIMMEKRAALVIGNAAYKSSPLRNPVNDSNDMAKSLRAIGFDVVEINNANLSQMREATRVFSEKLAFSDVGLIYYSGHGIEIKGRNFLIPVNADIKREYEVVDQAFDASQFLEMIDNIRGPNNKRVNILIIDACRNNELQRSWRSTNNGLARMDAPGGTFISFATAPGKVAADGEGRNSPYTKHLLQALKQPNVPIEQVFKLVRRNVMDETKGEQIPWENSSLIGDFYFTMQR